MGASDKLLNELAQRNYVNTSPIEDMLDAYTYVKDGSYFHTQDGRFAYIWQIGSINDESFSEDEKSGVASLLAYGLNRFPANACGQFIRFTHNNINGILNEFSQNISDAPFAKEIIGSTIDRQLQGATKGFFSNISADMIDKAKDDLFDEFSEDVEDDGSKESASINIERAISTGRYANHSESFLIFIYSPPWSSGANLFGKIYHKLLSGFGFLNLYKLYASLYASERKKFLRHKDNIQQALTTGNFNISVITGQGLVDALYRELNPERNLNVASPTYRSSFTIREFIGNIIKERAVRNGKRTIGSSSTYSPINTTQKGWQIGKTFYRACSVKHLPTTTRAGMIMEAIRLTEGRSWVSCNFHVGSQSSVRRALSVRKGALWSKENAFAHMPMFKPDMQQLQNQKDDMDYISHATNPEERETELVFNASFHCIMIGDNEEETEQRATDLQEHLWQEGYFETDRGDAIVHHSLPLNMRKTGQRLLQRYSPTLSSNFADLCPIFTSYQGLATNHPTKKKAAVLVNSAIGEPIYINPFHDRITAAHSIFVGGTGSGKSFMVNTILGQMKSSDKMKIFIIDKGNSYQSFCESNGGSYVKLMLDDEDGVTPTCLNPLYTGMENGKRRPPDKIELEFIHGTLKAMALSRASEDSVVKTTLNPEDLGLMLQALTKLFETHPIEQEIILTDYVCYLQEHYGEKGESIARQLFEYTKDGLFGKLFDGPLQADWEADTIVFETDKLSGSSCLPIVMVVLFYQIEMYSKHILGKNVRKILAIDEAWAALAQPSIAKIIAGYFREMRKHNMGIFLISQTIEDFAKLVAMEIGDGNSQSGIIQNTKHYYLLSCNATDHPIGKKLLSLTDEDVAMWQSVSSLPPYYSEVYYRAIMDDDRPYSGKFRVVSNPVSLWIGTTTPEDVEIRKARIKEKKEQGMTAMQAQRAAIIELSKEYPYGSRYAA